MRAATTTTGMTTAIAVLPVLPRPLFPDACDPDALSAEGDDEDAVAVLEEEVVLGGAAAGGGSVDVTTTTEGC